MNAMFLNVSKNVAKNVSGFVAYNVASGAFTKITEPVVAKIESIENSKTKTIAKVAYTLTGVIVSVTAANIVNNLIENVFTGIEENEYVNEVIEESI